MYRTLKVFEDFNKNDLILFFKKTLTRIFRFSILLYKSIKNLVSKKKENEKKEKNKKLIRGTEEFMIFIAVIGVKNSKS